MDKINDLTKRSPRRLKKRAKTDNNSRIIVVVRSATKFAFSGFNVDAVWSTFLFVALQKQQHPMNGWKAFEEVFPLTHGKAYSLMEKPRAEEVT